VFLYGTQKQSLHLEGHASITKIDSGKKKIKSKNMSVGIQKDPN
jgi:hypothetical protein